MTERMPKLERRDTTTLTVALLAAYLGQAAVGLEVPMVVRWQADETYKAITGLVLVAYLALQWSSTLRKRGLHELFGAFAPLVLYAHATRFAYGYLVWLLVIYLGVGAIGLVHRPIVARRRRTLYVWWFVAHIAMSVLLVVLVAYHVVIAIAYE